MEDELNLPPGFRFTPSDEELVTFYLKPKILGEELPCNIVEEKEVYGGDKTPWEVFNSEKDKWQVSGKTKKSSIYVFVKLEKKKRKKKKEGWRNKEQFVRAAGCGTWDGQTGPKEIMNGNGEIIGVKRMLVFEMNDTSDNLKLLENLKKEKKTTGYWIMHEYSLVSDHSDSDHYVLCEISRDDLRNSKIKSCPKRSSDLAIQSYGEEDLVLPLATTSTSSGGGVEEKEDLQFRAMEKKIYCPWDDYLDVDEIFNYQSTEEIQAYACMAESFEGGLEQQQQQQLQQRDIKELGKRKIEDEDTTTN